MVHVLQILLGLFVLGVLVIVHELGHFLFAKLFGIRVLSFSIGFGKVLLKKTIGETEYRISAIPFGGYVHMAGEHPDDPGGAADDEFNAKPVWQRACVAVAGPGFNYLFALFCLWLSFVIGVEQPLYLDNPSVGYVADSSAAADAGILPGDRIISINGGPVSDWTTVEKAFTNLKTDFAVTLERDGRRLNVRLVRPAIKDDRTVRHPTGGISPLIPPVVGTLLPGSPAETAGILPGDSVTAVGGAAVTSWQQFSSAVNRFDSASGSMRLTISREGALFTFAVTPAYNRDAGRFLIGVNLAEQPVRVVRSGPIAAVPQSWNEAARMVALIFESLDKLIRLEVSPRQLAGPVGIVQMSGGIALMGLVRILNFMALIGINLGLINLLPLVITDGGLILFMAVEALRGKPLPLKYQLIVNRAAIAFFIILAIFVTFNDLGRISTLFRMTGR